MSTGNPLRALVLAACIALPAGAEPIQQEAVRVRGQFDAPTTLSLAPSGDATALVLSGVGELRSTTATVRSVELIGVPRSQAVLVTWEEVDDAGRSEPWYAISLDGTRADRVTRTSYDVRLWQGGFEPRRGQPPVPEGLAAADDSRLHLVQFVTQPLEEFHGEVERLGGTIHRYVAHHAYTVEMDAAAAQQVGALPFVRWVGPYHPAYRIDPRVVADLDRLDPAQRYNVQVLEKSDLQKRQVASKIASLGGNVISADSGARLVLAALTPEQLVAVAAFDEVHFIDRWGPYEEDIDLARELGGANHIETVAGYTGAGVRGEVLDTGFNLIHVDLPNILVHGPAPSSSSHGASTSGIVFGKGLGNSTARGMLPDGQPIVADWSFISTGMPRYTHTGELKQSPYFAVFQTASVGSPRDFFYTTISADTDEALFDFDILHFQSQSNAGNQDSRPQSWAKNIIGVGGVNHYDNTDPSDDDWNFSGSIGPAADGRVKPDLANIYDGVFTVTCCGSNSYTTSFCCTSAATPITAGLSGLYFEMWHDGIFGNQVGNSVFDSAPHMSTSKAMLINTARQWSFSGTGHDLTRVHQGWGQVDVKNMYDQRTNIFFVDETDVLSNLQSTDHFVDVPAGEPALRATLVYADPPGNPAVQSQHRVNDLTLRVESPSGTHYFGNNGLLAGNWSTSGGVANTIDTVENVFVQNPEAGIWKVTVSADEIVQDGHVETGAMDADYALVVSGVAVEGAPVTYCTGKLNSDLCVPFITTTGVASASSTNPFRVRAQDVIPFTSGLLIYGYNGRSTLSFHNAKLCVKSPLIRLLPPKFSGASAGACVGTLSVNFNNRIQSGGDPLLTAGQQINGQWLYRDPGIDAFNDGLSNGVEFTINP